MKKSAQTIWEKQLQVGMMTQAHTLMHHTTLLTLFPGWASFQVLDGTAAVTQEEEDAEDGAGAERGGRKTLAASTDAINTTSIGSCLMSTLSPLRSLHLRRWL